MRLTIEQMQNAILEAGYQLQENMFNDNKMGERKCYIRFTRCQSPHYFSDFNVRDEWRETGNEDCIGWGRFERQDAWEQAYRKIIGE